VAINDNSCLCIGLSELIEKPFDVLSQLDGEPVAVFHDNRPAFYIVSPQALRGIRRPTLEQVPYLQFAEKNALNIDSDQSSRIELLPPSATRERVVLDSHQARNTPTILQLSDRLVTIETRRQSRGELSKAAIGILRNRLDAHVLPFFGRMSVDEINADTLDRFLARLFEFELSSTTVSQYFVIVRKLLKLAVRLGHRHDLPEMPKIRTENRPRSMIAIAEYRALVRTAWRLSRRHSEAPKIKERDGTRERFWVHPRNLMLSPDMPWVISFMINSFVRPSDIRNLKHKHVQIVRGDHTYLRLTLPESKRHDLPIVTMTPAVRVYEAARRRAQALGCAEPDDYVFLPEEHDRTYALAVLGFWFKWVMREARVPQVDHLGRERTLYSLRHTAIMFRLLYGEGIDMLTLARNARTSVQMIERFYASSLTGEMNVGLLQSRRKTKARRQ
jgi:hypothetical protein